MVQVGSVDQLKVKHGIGQSYTADNSSLSSTAHPSRFTLSHFFSQDVGCHGT